MLVKIFTTVGKARCQELPGVAVARGALNAGGQSSSTTTHSVMSHVGVTAHTGPWDELLPQLCPCKGPLGSNVFSLLYTPMQNVKINPLSENSLIFPAVSLAHTTFFPVNTQSLRIS